MSGFIYGHDVKPKDKARIRCQIFGCSHQADHCLYLPWSMGTGQSYFYYCQEHTDAILITGKKPYELQIPKAVTA